MYGAYSGRASICTAAASRCATSPAPTSPPPWCAPDELSPTGAIRRATSPPRTPPRRRVPECGAARSRRRGSIATRVDSTAVCNHDQTSDPTGRRMMPGRGKKETKVGTYKAGRDARTGKFIPVKEAQRRKATAVVETMKKGGGKKK